MSRTNRIRFVDVALITIAAPVWVPTLTALALTILVTSGRPVLFRQDRIGLGGTKFSIRKFRSMTVGDNPLIPDPTCITPIGRLMRRTSLDELPQLLNVLDGSMSLVGPRPMLPKQGSELTAEQQQRHLVRPGLTGLAQVNGRNSLSWSDRIRHDITWAKDPHLRSYAATLWKTVRPVITGHGIDGHDVADPLVVAAISADDSRVLCLDDFTIELSNDADSSTISQSAA